jgi:hypothetical protein
MKKLVLSISLFIGIQAFAQKDIRATLVSPANNGTIIQGEAFNLTARFKNIGVEDIPNTDTILLTFTLNGQGIGITFANGLTVQAFRVELPNGLAVGADTIFSLTNVNFPNIGSEATRPFCVVALLRSDGSTIEESDLANNTSCSNLAFRFTSLQELNAAANTVKVFPNPAQSSLNINFEYNGGSSIKIFDMAGRVVKTVAEATSTNNINVGDLSKGVYMYEIRNENNDLIKNGKVAIN